MIKIAHRGNINGPNLKFENSPHYLMNAIQEGYDVEVDLWVLKNGSISLGHDEPQYQHIPESFLLEIGHAAWFHCKNLDAINFLRDTFPHLNYFWHQDDDYTLTSQGYIWTYPNKDIVKHSIIVDLDNSHPDRHLASGICSDYVGSL